MSIPLSDFDSLFEELFGVIEVVAFLSVPSQIVVLTIFTGLVVFLKTRSVLYGLAGLIFAPFLWYVAVGGAIVDVVLLFPLFHVVWKLIA